MSKRIYVREIGYVVDMYGHFIHVGTDYGAVTIKTFAAVTLSAAQREQLDRLLYLADREVAVNIEALKALDEDSLAEVARAVVTA